ncbi:MAG: bifunctional proline dehydrogenase/L-glutamate gamma-semialdehyde dehydrogenase PutA [Alphaproteobacteria bacterium]|nr:bifunctional proline dehydrogenase/L-glutamate gamma-semialdehyde dehydrogenase PutA [Alphaproteobacteria bacterium]
MPVSFSSFYTQTEEQAVQAVLQGFDWSPERAQATRERAIKLIESIRTQKRAPGQLESFLQEYALDTQEGLALMCLAEALLRVPDKATAGMLIRDKVAAANWLDSAGGSKDWVVKAAGLGLFMTNKTLEGALSRIGEPFVREAMIKAMQILGKQFVLGRDIEEAFQNAQPLKKKGYRLSYDILGEGARTEIDAVHYFESYAAAIRYIGDRDNKNDTKRPGISVKLSALHPRYSFAQEERCVPEMTARLSALAQLAAERNLALTVDAEESERLNTALRIIEAVITAPQFKDWNGFGLAVQAYSKAALPVIDHVTTLAREHKKQVQIRLVKGAYWDSEIKKTQIAGLENFPVYTRKYHTDAAYLACAARMLGAGEALYPMFGTHNAASAAAILEMAGTPETGQKPRFEFQRLFGMGQALHDLLLENEQIPVSLYAPVGPHEDLLPYLVRRLLENGANTSFVNRVLDADAPVDDLVACPVDKSIRSNGAAHPEIIPATALFKNEKPVGRLNSRGLDLHAPEVIKTLENTMAGFMPDSGKTYTAAPLIAGKSFIQTIPEIIINPADFTDTLGKVYPANDALMKKAFSAAQETFPLWSNTKADTRAKALETLADLYEKHTAELMALCVREAGKTLPDALAEIREAMDFCRYYAAQGRAHFAETGLSLPGPTGESNTLTLRGRGTFICISPWNFPLAIFTGQIAAALIAGNCVIAKPAEQTPLIAARAVELMHEAGIPPGALALLPGDGRIGAALCAHAQVAGVAFTGSTAVAQEINRTLAAKNGPIVPLIAETGGQNAMIVDSSALPEQVVDDVLTSAFGSAGQRCSALRVLCLQEDTADKIIRLLQGAMKTLNIGTPARLSSDIGPVIDEEARGALLRHREALRGFGKPVFEIPVSPALNQNGFYFGPCAFEIPAVKNLGAEVFGPILHIVRYKKAELADILSQITDTGYGLTLGVHSRIQSFHEQIIQSLPAGNVYINRSMTGAIVGSQPFGGTGLSGTGPKAGGPHYLARFATERSLCINTAAAGGNASLVSLGE